MAGEKHFCGSKCHNTLIPYIFQLKRLISTKLHIHQPHPMACRKVSPCRLWPTRLVGMGGGGENVNVLQKEKLTLLFQTILRSVLTIHLNRALQRPLAIFSGFSTVFDNLCKLGKRTSIVKEEVGFMWFIAINWCFGVCILYLCIKVNSMAERVTTSLE